MKISTILDHIDSGHMALPEFQRGYVWNRDQVRGLVWSLYKRFPVGSLLVWATESEGAAHRGEHELAAGIVKLLLDGQQRMTSLYGLIRGKPPAFFDGDAKAFTGLYFNMENEEFSFYMPSKMQGNPLWVDVSRLMQENITPFVGSISANAELAPNLAVYVQRLTQLHSLQELDIHIEEVSGRDKSVDVVVDIFNRVNSGGTKLSKGDLALAKICASEPQARDRMRQAINRWQEADFDFAMDWLLRNVTTLATGEARFSSLHDVDAELFSASLGKALKHIDYLLDVIGARLGLDHGRVLFGHYSFPVLMRHLDEHGGVVSDETELRKVLFWYLHCALWGRYSGSTETILARDMALLAVAEDGMERLINELMLWRGNLNVRAEHFTGWSRGARFYPMLYLLTRVGDAKDWGLGIPLKKGMLGKNTSLEVHHIFPRNLLKKSGYGKAQINAVANFCFLTKNTNLKISDRPPEQYFEEISARFPGALESQWIPMDPELWKAENYPEFLAARRALLAGAANEFLDDLYLVTEEQRLTELELSLPDEPPGGIESADEERVIQEIRDWMSQHKLPSGEVEMELRDAQSGEVLAVLDLAWPDGLQTGLSAPLALLLDEPTEVLTAAAGQGYKIFEQAEDLRLFVAQQVLGDVLYGMPDWAQEVDPSALPVVHHIVGNRLPAPLCGHELVNDNEAVVAEFELAWPEQRVGIWTRRGSEGGGNASVKGWATFSLDELRDTPTLLDVALGR